MTFFLLEHLVKYTKLPVCLPNSYFFLLGDSIVVPVWPLLNPPYLRSNHQYNFYNTMPNRRFRDQYSQAMCSRGVELLQYINQISFRQISDRAGRIVIVVHRICREWFWCCSMNRSIPNGCA